MKNSLERRYSITSNSIISTDNFNNFFITCSIVDDGYVNQRLIENKLIQEIETEGVIDNYYFNVIDWMNDVLIVGVSNSLFTFHSKTNEASTLMENEELLTLICGDVEGGLCLIDIEMNQLIGKGVPHNKRIGRITVIYNALIKEQNSKKCCNETKVDGEVCGITSNEKYIAVGTSNHSIYVYDKRYTQHLLTTNTRHKSAIKAITFDLFRSNVLLSGGGIYDKQIQKWNICTNEYSTYCTQAQIVSIDYGPITHNLIVSLAYPFNGFLILDKEMNCIEKINGHSERIITTSFNENNIFASLGADSKIKLWCF
ncbi:WD domain [Entamoeba marina]